MNLESAATTVRASRATRRSRAEASSEQPLKDQAPEDPLPWIGRSAPASSARLLALSQRIRRWHLSSTPAETPSWILQCGSRNTASRLHLCKILCRHRRKENQVVELLALRSTMAHFLIRSNVMKTVGARILQRRVAASRNGCPDAPRLSLWLTHSVPQVPQTHRRDTCQTHEMHSLRDTRACGAGIAVEAYA